MKVQFSVLSYALPPARAELEKEETGKQWCKNSSHVYNNKKLQKGYGVAVQNVRWEGRERP